MSGVLDFASTEGMMDDAATVLYNNLQQQVGPGRVVSRSLLIALGVLLSEVGNDVDALAAELQRWGLR